MPIAVFAPHHRTPALRPALVAIASVLIALGGPVSASGHVADRAALTVRAVEGTVDDGTIDDSDDTTRPTINEFFPEERALSDCLSSLPKPDCGSEARGGWAQGVVLLAILGGLALIGWRIWVSSKRARLSRTPDATTARDGDGGAP